MSEQALRELVDRLRREVAELPSDAPGAAESRRRLEAVIDDLSTRLDDDDDNLTDTGGLRGSIQDTIHQIEARHPDATTVLNNIMMTLANMGI